MVTTCGKIASTLQSGYIEDLEWNRLGLQLNKMMEVVADRDVWLR